MLFNRSTGKSITDDMLSLDSLIAWLEQRPADGTYDYCSSTRCLLVQYFTAMGAKGVMVLPDRYITSARSLNRKEYSLPEGWEEIAIAEFRGPGYGLNPQWTYGAALQRAKGLKYGRAA